MPWWNIQAWGGSRMLLPTLRGQDYEQPYRAGQQWRAKYPNSRTVSLAMWTAGISQSTGGPDPVDQRLAFNNNFQQLRQLFWTVGPLGSLQGTLVRRWWLTQNSSNLIVKTFAAAEIAGSMEPTPNHRANSSFTVDLLLSDPYFYGSTLRSQGITTGGGTISALGEGVVGSGYPQSGVSAFTVTISGPGTVTNTTPTPHVAFTFAPLGQCTYPVVLDILNDTATDAAGLNQIAGVTHTGARMWMGLLNGANVITNTTGATATFAWNDCYI